MRQRYLRRRGPRPEDAQPPEPYQPTPEEQARWAAQRIQEQASAADYRRRLAAGEVKPVQVLEQIRTND